MSDINAIKISAGARLRARRRAMGMTLRSLADASGLSERYVGQAERGQANLSLEKLHAMCQALGLPMHRVIWEGPEAHSIISLLGVRGAGKSTVGEALAEALGRPFLELDARIEALAELSLAEIFAVHGEAYYRRLERDALELVLGEGGPAVVATGGSLVTHRETYALLKRATVTVWLKARPEDHWDRVIQQGDRRPMRDHPHAMAELQALLVARAPLYREARITVDTAQRAVEEVVDEILRIVAPDSAR